MAICTFAIKSLVDVMQLPAFISEVRNHSVWLADNMLTVTFIVATVLLLFALSIPVKSNSSEFLGTYGVIAIWVLAFAGVGFLSSMGWMAAEFVISKG
jgi:hypothetical protein